MFGSSKIQAQITDIEGTLMELRAEVRRLNQEVSEALARKEPATDRAHPVNYIVRKPGGAIDAEATARVLGKSVPYILSNRPWPQKSAEWAVVQSLLHKGRPKGAPRTSEDALREYGPEQLDLFQ